jgi:phage gp36-like protein
MDANGTAGVGTNIIGTYAMSLSQEWADNIIDMKIGKRYTVPFGTASVPPVIKSLSTTLSAWGCLRSLYTGEIPASIAQVKEEYDRALKFLDEIQNGDLDIPAGDGSLIDETSENTKYWSSTMNYVPTFDVDNELNWHTDINRLQDIGDKRASE